MTMVPSQNGKQISNYVFYNNTSAMNQVEAEGSYNCLLGSDFFLRHMAEEESSSRATNTTSTTHHHHNQNQNQPEPEAEAAGSTSKEEEEGEGANNNNNSNWLQLGIGFHQSHTAAPTTKHDRDHHHHHHHRDRASSAAAPTTSSGLVELDLLPPTEHHFSRTGLESLQPTIFPVAAGRGCQLGGSSAFGSSLLFEQMTTTLLSSSSSSSSISMSTMPGGPTFGHHQPHQEMMNLAFGPLLPHSMAIMPSSSSFIPSFSTSSSLCSSLRPPLGSYYPSQFTHPFPSSSSPSPSGFDQLDVAGPSSDISVRVVDPPKRPHSGIWFMLQASQNQSKEPFLPQIPKNYLRIKDGRMTVRLLLKYLVSKLKLESESEIEITCRGQQLLPFLTLQHVRDNIWTQRDTTRPLLSDSSTTDHVMVLHYGRATT